MCWTCAAPAFDTADWSQSKKNGTWPRSPPDAMKCAASGSSGKSGGDEQSTTRRQTPPSDVYGRGRGLGLEFRDKFGAHAQSLHSPSQCTPRLKTPIPTFLTPTSSNPRLANIGVPSRTWGGIATEAQDIKFLPSVPASGFVLGFCGSGGNACSTRPRNKLDARLGSLFWSNAVQTKA